MITMLKPADSPLADEIATPAGHVELAIVTPDTARTWLETAAYEGQRPRSDGHVGFLAEVMRRGEFKMSTVEFRVVDGHPYLINGQHTLAAVARSGLAQRLIIVTETVPDLAAVARDYGRCDRGRGRNLADLYAAYHLDDELRVPARDLRKLGGAVRIINDNFQTHHGAGYSSKSGELRVGWMREWQDEARAYLAAITGASAPLKARLRLATVLSVGLVTLRHAPALARPFWREIALNDGLRRNQPTHTLIEYFGDLGNRWGRAHEGTVERACARAWNAYYNGRTLEKIMGTDPSRPIVIDGTPWDGSRP